MARKSLEEKIIELQIEIEEKEEKLKELKKKKIEQDKKRERKESDDLMKFIKSMGITDIAKVKELIETSTINDKGAENSISDETESEA